MLIEFSSLILLDNRYDFSVHHFEDAFKRFDSLDVLIFEVENEYHWCIYFSSTKNFTWSLLFPIWIESFIFHTMTSVSSSRPEIFVLTRCYLYSGAPSAIILFYG